MSSKTALATLLDISLRATQIIAGRVSGQGPLRGSDVPRLGAIATSLGCLKALPVVSPSGSS